MTALQTARRVEPIDWADVPENFLGKLSAVCRTAGDCAELVRWFGDASFAPNLPVLVMVPGAHAPTLIAGMGYASAAELQDCAVVTWEEQTTKLAEGSPLLDYDAARERRGLPRREEVDAATRDALLRRVAAHMANPVTDPFRQPTYPNPTNKTNFVIREKVPDA